MYKIEMTRTTSGEVVYQKEYANPEKAYERLTEICDERGYEVKESPMNDGYVAGGHGFDYVITLEEVDEEDVDSNLMPFLSIDSMQDVVELINGIFKLGVNFHPDTRFEDYVNPVTHLPSFTARAALVYNYAVGDAEDLCEKFGVDIYELVSLFDFQGYDKVLAYFEDGKLTIGFKHHQVFYGSVDLGDDAYTAYHQIEINQ